MTAHLQHQYIVIAERRQRGRDGYQIHLTDTEVVRRRRFWRSATVALMDVRRLLRKGHRPAHQRALACLVQEAMAEMAAQNGGGHAA